MLGAGISNQGAAGELDENCGEAVDGREIAYTWSQRPIVYENASHRRTLRRTIAAIIPCLLLVACAGTQEEDLEYMDRSHECRTGETPSCIEKGGKPVRCFCADEDALRELLDPNYGR